MTESEVKTTSFSTIRAFSGNTKDYPSFKYEVQQTAADLDAEDILSAVSTPTGMVIISEMEAA